MLWLQSLVLHVPSPSATQKPASRSCLVQEGEAQLAELAALLHESMDHKYS